MKKLLIVILLLIGGILLGGSILAAGQFDIAIEEYNNSILGVNAFFENYKPDPFINEAALASPVVEAENNNTIGDYEVRSSWRAPEGFNIISYSDVWDIAKLELLYEELMKNRIGKEIELLYEIVIYPEEGDEFVLGMFSQFTASSDFRLDFPALPPDFSIAISRNVGRIVLNGGDTNNTIESMASVLSHEYGHLFTFYHMFALSFNNLESSDYALIRSASRYGLITGEQSEEYYRLNRHRFLIEVAAEDYVQLMGSPTTRQVGVFFDVRQMLINGSENPQFFVKYRNAVPQENMMLPLASEVPGLRDYFYSRIDEEPTPPVEERMEILLDIRAVTVEHNLVSGLTGFTHYVISWNAPYNDAIYTLAFFNPVDYRGWAVPVRTVLQNQDTNAIIGTFTRQDDDRIFSLIDGIAQGSRVFYVAAMLPDGTFYLSERLPVDFN